MRSVNLFVVLLVMSAGMAGLESLRAQASDVEGVWRGESLCASDASACHDERVVYYIKAVPNKPETVVIQADKIVDGKPITMGMGEWRYDRAGRTLEWRVQQQVWLLKIQGSRMQGTLTRTDGTVLRKVTLERRP